LKRSGLRNDDGWDLTRSLRRNTRKYSAKPGLFEMVIRRERILNIPLPMTMNDRQSVRLQFLSGRAAKSPTAAALNSALWRTNSIRGS